MDQQQDGPNGGLDRTGSPVTLREAQRQVDAWVSRHKAGYWPPLANLARLIEETGEVARLLNHMAGYKPKKPGEDEQDLALELADILYTVICLANSQGIDLEDAFRGVMHKVETRDRDRYERVQSAEAAEGEPWTGNNT